MTFALNAVRSALAAAALVALGASNAQAQQGQTVKIAWLDPLSGLMAAVGTNQLKSFQFLAEEFNKLQEGTTQPPHLILCAWTSPGPLLAPSQRCAPRAPVFSAGEREEEEEEEEEATNPVSGCRPECGARPWKTRSAAGVYEA